MDDMVGAVIATLGLTFGLWQYREARLWKRAEFAAKELEKLQQDPVLAMACLLLDWTDRTFAVPAMYQHKTTQQTFTHTWHELRAAMHPAGKPEDGSAGYGWQAVFYRDTFDHFFNYLERVNHYIDIGLVTTADMRMLRYWLDRLYAPEKAGEAAMFDGYLTEYGFEGVPKLAAKLGVKPNKSH